jgi:hypothetical protein
MADSDTLLAERSANGRCNGRCFTIAERALLAAYSYVATELNLAELNLSAM